MPALCKAWAGALMGYTDMLGAEAILTTNFLMNAFSSLCSAKTGPTDEAELKNKKVRKMQRKL